MLSAQTLAIACYSVPFILLLIWYFRKQQVHEQQSQQFLAQAKQDGLTEPVSLHPVINFAQCIGCGSCVAACPEHNVLGLIDRKAELVNPANCIGHGACKQACPEHAIELVFGNATRGVDIPDVSPKFESSIPGLYIAGELGGMGLIKNAIEQGKQAIYHLAQYCQTTAVNSDILDCVIVGAGPAGLSAALGAKEKNLQHVIIDQDLAGGTVSHFPKGKLVMTAPGYLPLVGRVKFSEVSKEKLLSFWLNIIEQYQIKINEKEQMLDIEKQSDGTFLLKSNKRQYHSKAILLAIGRRGTPRKLGVEGEHLTKVVYRLTDPEQYINQHVMVVGGGDSALEAACSIAELGNPNVSISYRSEAFSRAKVKNRERVQKLSEAGKLKLYMSSQIKQISENHISLYYQDQVLKIKNEAVIICAGGELPTPFLKKIGVSVTTKYGTA